MRITGNWFCKACFGVIISMAGITASAQERDTIPPVIELKGDQTITTCRWHIYIDEGYTVTDSTDSAASIRIDTIGTIRNGCAKNGGLYFLNFKATDEAGNTGTSETRYVLVNYDPYGCRYRDPNCLPARIEEGEHLPGFEIYPNPTTGQVTFTGTISGARPYVVTDITGRTIRQGVYDQVNREISLEGEPAGLYFLHIGSQALKVQLVR